jgi:hypothetical protein
MRRTRGRRKRRSVYPAKGMGRTKKEEMRRQNMWLFAVVFPF